MANLFSFLGEGPSAGLTPLELTAFTRPLPHTGGERPHIHTVYYYHQGGEDTLGRGGHRVSPQRKQRHCSHSPSHPQPPGTGTGCLHSVSTDTAATHHYIPGRPRWSILSPRWERLQALGF